MTYSIRDCLARALQLQDSDSARLDTELLLAAALERDRSYLFAWPERQLTAAQWQQFDHWMCLRQQGHPIAHLLGRREFWGLELEVNNATLIPRPDTELLVETALALQLPAACQLLDLGTGCGAIALALAAERPRWTVVAVDRSDAAVALAQRNCTRLGLANVSVLSSDWFGAVPRRRFDVIVSNPPYIPLQDPHLRAGDLRFEPHSALVSGGDGLDDLRTIVATARQFLAPDGWLLLEHGYNQGGQVRELLARSGYSAVATRTDLGGNPRVTLGQCPASAAGEYRTLSPCRAHPAQF